MSTDTELVWLSETVRTQAPLSAGIVPHSDSEAAHDDAYLRPYDALLTDLATFQLRSTWDHLQALEILLKFSKRTAPFAPYSLVRGGLVSAASAYCLVAGTAESRRRNALRILIEDSRRDRQFLEANFEARRHDLNEVNSRKFTAAIEQAEERNRRARSALSALAGELPSSDTVLREIEVVASAQSALDSSGLDADLKVAYMRLSGTIHALPWAAKRNRHSTHTNPDGTERYHHIADRDELLSCGKAVAHIAIAARSRLASLTSPHSAPDGITHTCPGISD